MNKVLLEQLVIQVPKDNRVSQANRVKQGQLVQRVILAL